MVQDKPMGDEEANRYENINPEYTWALEVERLKTKVEELTTKLQGPDQTVQSSKKKG